MALSSKELGAVEAEGSDVEEKLVGGWSWDRECSQSENRRWAGFMDDDGAHGLEDRVGGAYGGHKLVLYIDLCCRVM